MVVGHLDFDERIFSKKKKRKKKMNFPSNFVTKASTTVVCKKKSHLKDESE
jgi:hypothetical protein